MSLKIEEHLKSNLNGKIEGGGSEEDNGEKQLVDPSMRILQYLLLSSARTLILILLTISAPTYLNNEHIL